VVLWSGYLCIARGVLLCCVVPVMVRAAPVDAWVSSWGELSDHQADATGIIFFDSLEAGEKSSNAWWGLILF